MQELIELTNLLASTAVLAEPDDLPTLAALHTHFEKLSEELREVGSDLPVPKEEMDGQSAKMRELLEQVIRGEVADASAAVKQVCATIQEFQGMIQSAWPDWQGIGEEGEGGVQVHTQSVATAAVVAVAPVAAASSNASPAPAAAKSDEQPALSADDLPLVKEFIVEATEHLVSAEAAALRLEDEPQNLENVNAIFRSFHTIKGVAGFLNLKQIGELAHVAENLLDLARQGALELTRGTIDLVLEAADRMKSLVAALDAATHGDGRIAADGKLHDLLARLEACAKGTSPTAATKMPTPGAAPAPEAARVQHEVVPSPSHEPHPASSAKATATNTHAPAQATNASSGNADATVKVSTDRLDSLINMVGELVIAESMVRQDAAAMAAQNHRLSRNMAHLGKITRELQDLSMSMRMVPIQGVFQKMTRLVRDLARRFGKEVDLQVTGGETELDRNVVEAIADPLVHMVRNSIDHGIETPDKRVAAGKPRAGRLSLKAYHQGGNIVIEITDDGKGLNKRRILHKAIAAGIVQEDQQLTDQEIFELIFHAGLSTAEKVTEVSGRGVGMDVVRRNVEALRGRIDIASEEGKGSTFSIRLPLTLAVIDGLVVRVGPERYILPITSIEQSIQPKADQLSTLQNRGEMCLVRGSLLPLFRLHRLFEVKPKNEDPTQALVVIVQDNSRRCCLLVDELLGQQQVVIKSLGQGVGAVRGVSGGAILGDGNVSLILDVPGLIDLASS